MALCERERESERAIQKASRLILIQIQRHVVFLAGVKCFLLEK